MENRIKLLFTNNVNRLVGDKLGKDTYEKQVKEFINFTKLNIVVIPYTIDDISISFVQGFTQSIFENIRKDEFNKYFKVTGSQKVVDKFNKSINY